MGIQLVTEKDGNVQLIHSSSAVSAFCAGFDSQPERQECLGKLFDALYEHKRAQALNQVMLLVVVLRGKNSCSTSGWLQKEYIANISQGNIAVEIVAIVLLYR